MFSCQHPVHIMFSCQQCVDKRVHCAGAYDVELKPSRRNSREVCVQRSLRSKVITLSRQMPRAAVRQNELQDGAKCLVMTKGVRLNGRQYAQGDHVEYSMIFDRRNRNVDMDARSVGQIRQFYVFRHTQPSVKNVVFVEIQEREVLSKYRSVYELQHFDRGLSGDLSSVECTGKLLHIDSITFKVHIAPHWSNTHKLCAIPMWAAR